MVLQNNVLEYLSLISPDLISLLASFLSHFFLYIFFFNWMICKNFLIIFYLFSRCLCGLSTRIGFKKRARDVFTLEGKIASYRHLVSLHFIHKFMGITIMNSFEIIFAKKIRVTQFLEKFTNHLNFLKCSSFCSWWILSGAYRHFTFPYDFA